MQRTNTEHHIAINYCRVATAIDMSMGLEILRALVAQAHESYQYITLCGPSGVVAEASRRMGEWEIKLQPYKRVKETK